ncbi:MurNAc alpha-1-phosphate uridylyltransferase [Hoeflea halophila]|uniref:MurNAc alpha-1-phosphate uridylyltransferase n=1 Tax=Hoeflea halophila TaxID=714899 RepID=A0A286ICG0_9HYPH|nr:nucleotidyltransferase family protein [Hoeflea halophila]SOE16994.1 MurNAc alpha-1-phosphate uridylyltransferase [Hoeflea halophila]
MTIDTAMILAAGLGTRMRPITETLPKPLVDVAGKPLIAYGLEALSHAGVSRSVVNVHYLAPLLTDWLSKQSGMTIEISDETDQLLDSGGGIVKALPLLGTEPFLVLNADTFWLEEPGSDTGNLTRMVDRFDPESMDILLMTARLDQATGHTGAGDFVLSEDGRLARFRGQGDPVIYAGAIILHPRIFEDITEPKFSLNRCFDSAEKEGRLFGMPMRGHWLTVGTPEAIGEAEAARARYLGEPVR